MDLLNRYLQAIKKHLPLRRQDDILAELRVNLESQLEEHEAAFGRPLTRAEAEAWLMEIGPPMQVAARYLPQQYLIGPTIFPTYWWVLRISMVWGFVILTIVTAVQIMARGFDSSSALALHDSGAAILQSAIQELANIPFALMQIAGWVTVTFAAFEFAVAQGIAPMPRMDALSRDWPPSKLPPVERTTESGAKPRTRAQAIGEVVFEAMLLIWLPLIPRHPILILGPGAKLLDVQGIEFAPACYRFYLALMALNLLQLIWNSVDLTRGSWQEQGFGKRVAFKLFGLVPLLLLITVPGHVLLILHQALLNPANAARFGQLVDGINHWSHVGLTIAFVLSLCQLISDLAQWGRAVMRDRAPMAR